MRQYFTPSSLKGQKGVHITVYGPSTYKTQTLIAKRLKNQKGLFRWVINKKEYTPTEVCNYFNQWIADKTLKKDGTNRSRVNVNISLYDDPEWLRRKYGTVKHINFTIKEGRLTRDF